MVPIAADIAGVVAVEGGDADAGAAGDPVQRHLDPALGEHLGRGADQPPVYGLRSLPVEW
jgi:hypothetical protein